MADHEILPHSGAIAACAGRIAAAPDVAALVACAAEARQLATDLHQAEAGAALVTGVLSRLNDAIAARILVVLQQRFRLPPARWCWLGLGSEGRLEQTLTTDQDNGLVFSASDDGEAQQLRQLFLPFARAANQALAECGFPLCDGEVMAGNPRWCLSQSEWLEGFSAWVRTPEPEALLNAAIFFDFRPVAGDAELATGLRQALSELTRGNEIFLRMMTVNALAAAPPLGRLRDFVTEADSGGMIDLKKFGSRIFVDAARIMALGAGAAETSTAMRLRRMAAEGIMTAIDAEAAVHAFHALQGIRLAVQAAAVAGGTALNQFDPQRLNEFDRRVLLEALRQARALQQRLKTRFHIET
ncbi:MAG: nucleotidyltransferase [Betaproteobacteria bacterium]|nr:nucleotidyltransferase [Betaproteobacteria bacterium]